jgi:hypothetical protein
MSTEVKTYPVLDESIQDKKANTWTHKCGSVVMAARVLHPVWVRPFTGGFGEVDIEVVPYCPTCESKPSSDGAPVYV